MDIRETPKSEAIFFTINEVARQVGVIPTTIRNWEKAGLFTAKRSANGYRIFSLSDIEHLKKIKCQSKDNRIGINAIRMLTNTESMSAHDAEGSAVSKKLMSSKWREYRLSRGYRLEDVAREIGISPSYLSKIENAQANVSYDVLQKLAKFYGENILYYVDDSQNDDGLVRLAETEPFGIGIAGLKINSLITKRHHTLSAMYYTAKPGTGRPESSHTGEEFVHMISGEIEFRLGEQTYHLCAGDSFCFESSEKHGWKCVGLEDACILWVYTPITRL